MLDIGRDFIYQAGCEACLPLHHAIIADLYTQLDAAQTIKSHFFRGRFENIYISEEKIPGLQTILSHIKADAARILQAQAGDLKLGFWFNLMQQGDVTLPHSHDDDDELLSGTYYLQVPSGSAALLIHLPQATTKIEPLEGQYVFFHPAVEHEVTQHNSAIARISLGFNLGLEPGAASVG
jgi:hypothetical protein